MRTKFFISDSLNLNAEQVADNSYIIHLSNGKQIAVVERPEYNGNTWAWKIDTQYFSRDDFAIDYLKRLVAEKLTGVRIIYHKKQTAPMICGVDGSACRCPGECNTALCSFCPVAEAFFADRDGVKLVYAV